MGASCTQSTNEAADFSNSDAYTLLMAALKEKLGSDGEYCYIYLADVFDDYLVYSNGYSGQLMRCDYDLSADGVVTLGEATPVVRKVQYIVADTTTESEIDLESDAIPLVESMAQYTEADRLANLTEATRMLKLIAPGKGSSGTYTADVLQRDGPKVFKAGTHNYIDHPTAQEESQRPEGTITRLASVLTEDAKWFDDYKGAGSGLYAPAKVNETFATFLDTFGNDIGVSIRARGKVDQSGVVESITSAKSVDYVTRAGAGGRVLDLMESWKPHVNKGDNMADTPVVKVEVDTKNLEETIIKFNARFVQQDAKELVNEALKPVKIAEAIKTKISSIVLANVPLTEAHQIDEAKLKALVESVTKAELEYLMSVGDMGKIKNVGATSPTEPIDLATAQKRLSEALAKI